MHAQTKDRRLEWAAFTWTLLVAVIGAAFFFGGRMESPADKEKRARRVAREVVAEMVPPREVREDIAEIKQTLEDLRDGQQSIREALAREGITP